MKENIWPAVYVTSIETRLKKGQAAINKRKSDSQKRAIISPPPSAKKEKNIPNPKKYPTTLSVKMAQTIPTATATPASQKKHSRKLPHKQQKVQCKQKSKKKINRSRYYQISAIELTD